MQTIKNIAIKEAIENPDLDARIFHYRALLGNMKEILSSKEFYTTLDNHVVEENNKIFINS